MRNGSETKIVEVSFIRHGATAGNLEHRYIGTTDERLCEAGREELYKKEKEEADIVFASPMKRCVETAEILYPKQQVHQIEEWREMDFGEFEGKNYEELDGNAAYQAWIDSNGTLPFPGGESREAFVARVLYGMEKMSEELFRVNGKQDDAKWDDAKWDDAKRTKVACVVHGGTIMAVLSQDTGEDYFSFSCKNGESYHCIYECRGAKRRLLSYEKKGN